MGRPDQIESVLLDASSLIGVIKGEKEFECLKPLLAAIDRGQIRLVESTAILAEVVPAHGQDGSAHAVARETVRALLEAPATDLVDVSVAVARKADCLAETFARNHAAYDIRHGDLDPLAGVIRPAPRNRRVAAAEAARMTSPDRVEGTRPLFRSAPGAGSSYLRCHHCRQDIFHTWGHWIPRRHGIRT